MPRKFNTFTNFEKEQLIDELNKSKNIEEFLNILLSEFNMEKSSPGVITKNILSSNMVKIVLPMINPEQRIYE